MYSIVHCHSPRPWLNPWPRTHTRRVTRGTRPHTHTPVRCSPRAQEQWLCYACSAPSQPVRQAAGRGGKCTGSGEKGIGSGEKRYKQRRKGVYAGRTMPTGCQHRGVACRWRLPAPPRVQWAGRRCAGQSPPGMRPPLPTNPPLAPAGNHNCPAPAPPHLVVGAVDGLPAEAAQRRPRFLPAARRRSIRGTLRRFSPRLLEFANLCDFCRPNLGPKVQVLTAGSNRRSDGLNGWFELRGGEGGG